MADQSDRLLSSEIEALRQEGKRLRQASADILGRIAHLRQRTAPPDEEATAPFPSPPATILVVDDEPISRKVAYRILSEEGYRVLEASSCGETLDALRLSKGSVDLVIIDVVMPEWDGVAVGRHVLERWPEQRILYMSAHPAEILARHGLTTLNVPFLAKPYTRDEVLAKVKEARAVSPAPDRSYP